MRTFDVPQSANAFTTRLISGRDKKDEFLLPDGL
jgi:hypothetical protein